MDFIPVVQATALSPSNIVDDAAPTIAASSIISIPEDELNNRNLDQLVKEGYSSGLIQFMAELKSTTAKSIWLIDDSGSMITYDGRRLAESPYLKDRVFFADCTRWEELTQCLRTHIKLAGALRFPSSFRFLNGWESFSVCDSPDRDADTDVRSGLDILSRKKPDGPTPLRQHIMAIHSEIQLLVPELLASGQRVSVVLCTDGLPSDSTEEDFICELRRLESLPISIVVRLCTDEDAAVQFYNRLDAELEVPVDVIDDFLGESVEVAEYNPWLNYAMPLHHLREMGVRDRVLDLLDERPLSPQQKRDVCTIIFGEQKMAECPDPAIEWLAFLGYMDSVLAGEQQQWDPIQRKLKPWVNFRKPKPRQRKARKVTQRRHRMPGCFAWR